MTGTTETLTLPKAMREEIVAHARAEAPRECCGVIAGRDGRPTRLYRLTNLEPGVDRYLIDDEEIYRVYREIEDGGEDLLAIYHSHPVSVAYPSKTDVAFAFWSESFYVICSLEHPDEPVIRAFRIVDEQIAEVVVSR
ncbi:MAG: [CysO sulfur-carrier protein]-S-L-cysteine hydrolase [Thermomicrobiales bacterium]|jgi:proteasome lid subunit RPN8/RPN11|nr:[CysO sulfur-carrier protein]-S-L-cysteine hydrolase [Thermomicrobiales bacterium]